MSIHMWMRFGLVWAVLGSVCSQECKRFATKSDNSPHSPKFVYVDIKSKGVCESYRLYLVTYATHTERADFCLTATSAVAYGFEINVIGVGRKANFNQNGPLDKLWAMRDFLKLVPDDPKVVVAFVDAYDTIMNGNAKTLVRRLLSSGNRVIFASERRCSSTKWSVMKGAHTCDDEWPLPSMKTANPHLNSGAFIGYRRELVRLMDLSSAEYNLTVSEMTPSDINPYRSGTDQLLICQIFSYGGQGPGSSNKEQIRKELGMSIDYHNMLFMCMYDVVLADGVNYTSSGRLVAKGSSTCNHLTKRFYYPCLGVAAEKSFPSVLHFNGAGTKKSQPLKQVAASIGVPHVNRESLWEAQFWDGEARPGGAGARLGDSCQQFTAKCKNKSILKCLAKHI